MIKGSIMGKDIMIKLKSRVFIFCLIFVFAVPFLFCQEISSPANLPSVDPLFIYDAGASFDDEDIVKVALEFSECPVSSPEGQSVLSRYMNLRKSVTDASFMKLSQSERAEKILSILYKEIIYTYKERQTRINVLFDEGTYNCVSSSVLYLALAKAASLDVRGQVTPNHAFCTLYLTDGSGGGKTKIDVETTNPYGFNPGVKKRVHENIKGGSYTIVPKRNYRGRYEVEDKIFVSLVGGNLVADYDKAGNWQKSVPMAAACVAFTQDCDGPHNNNRNEFEKTATNFVVSLQREKRYGTVLDWLDLLCDKWGAGKNLRNTYEKSLSNYIVALCRTGSFSAAKEAFDKRKEKVGSQMQKRIEQEIFEHEVQWHLDSVSGDDEAIAYLLSIRSLEISKSSRNETKIRQGLEHYWLNKINAAQSEGDYLYAASVADEGLECVPGSSVLKNAKNNCFHNHDAIFHNKFADFANKKQYDKALDELNKGLKGNPNSQVLKNDLKRLQNMMNKR